MAAPTTALPVSKIRVTAVMSLLIAFTLSACGHGGSPQAGVAPSSGGATPGASVLRDWRTDAPGERYLIRPSDLPAAAMAGSDPEASVAAPATVVPAPAGATPKVP